MNCREMFRQSSEKETKVQTQARKPNKEMVEGAVLGTRPIFLMLCVCLLELFRAIQILVFIYLSNQFVRSRFLFKQQCFCRGASRNLMFSKQIIFCPRKKYTSFKIIKFPREKNQWATIIIVKYNYFQVFISFLFCDICEL